MRYLGGMQPALRQHGGRTQVRLRPGLRYDQQQLHGHRSQLAFGFFFKGLSRELDLAFGDMDG